MKQFLSIFTIFFLAFSCEEKVQRKKSENSYLEYTVIKNNQPKVLDTALSDYDSLSLVKIDTSTLKGKRAYILNQFYLENPFNERNVDTLFDLNYDGFKDFVIPYYGQSGTGLKNISRIYLYKKIIKTYILDSLFSDKPNPSFFMKQKKVTSFYIANGGGFGEEYIWKNKAWTLNKTFDIDKKGNDFGNQSVWTVNYPSLKKTEKFIKAFRMIPYEDILQTNIKY